ncbi:MAG TPA: recombinase RecT [Acetobacteraceae bacterium]|nr:recombinase RecT [Acetobacteraceae bacterium]
MTALLTTRGAIPEADTLADVLRLSDLLAKSSMVPADYAGKPENVVVAVLWGREVGLGPLQALQNIAVINGRPAVWGDAALALVRAHPACEAVREGVEGDGDARHGWCEAKRRGQAPERRTFSVADAKRAKLWGKTGKNGNPTPWVTYPDRMLQLRARGFALRDVFADALRGVITVEEAADIPEEPRFVPSTAEGVLNSQETSAVGPTALVGAAAFGLDAFDNGLAGLASADDLRGYLADPGTRTWLERLRRNRPEQAAEADALISAAWARVDPSSRDEEPEPPWKGLAWPIAARDGSGMDMGDVDQWEAEFERRVIAVGRLVDVPAEGKRGVLSAILDANRGILAELRERGHGAAVEAVESLFAEALGAGRAAA